MGKVKKWTDATFKRAIRDVMRQWNMDRTPTASEVRQTVNVNCATDSGMPFTCTGKQLYDAINSNLGFAELPRLMGDGYAE